jgi:hypothetical protein
VSSRTKARELRRRRHRDQERQLARGRHPASAATSITVPITAPVAAPIAVLSGRGVVVVTDLRIAMPAASTLCGSGRLRGVIRPGRRPGIKNFPKPKRRFDGRANNQPPRPGRTVAPSMRDGDWALVTWTGSSMAMRRPSYWRTRDDAEAAAAAYRYEGRPYSIVDVSKSEKIDSNDTIIRETTRPVLANPYPPERVNLNPLSMSASYDGWNRAAARPVTSTFHG